MLKFILYDFELVTGLKINFQKIHLVELGIKHELTKDFATIVGCQVTTLPTHYLGIPPSLYYEKERLILPY